MMNSLLRRIKQLAVASFAFTVLAGVPAVATVAAAPVDIGGSACAGTNFDISGSDTSNCGSNDRGASNTVSNILKLVINILSVIVGFVAVLMIIIGGIKYVTSGGDSNNTASAKNTIIYAIIGLVIVALAQVLVHFVLTKTAVAAKPVAASISARP